MCAFRCAYERGGGGVRTDVPIIGEEGVCLSKGRRVCAY